MIIKLDTSAPLTTGDRAMLALLLGTSPSGEAKEAPARPPWQPSPKAVAEVATAFALHRNASLAARIASTVEAVLVNLPAPLSLSDEAVRAIFEDAFINREPGEDEDGIREVLSRLGTMARDEEDERKATK